MSVHYIRPMPEEQIDLTRDTQAAEDRQFWLGLTALIAALVLPVLVLFLAAEGIARAFDRPEACRALTAHECTAKLQGER